ncbi:MAG: hypothetical protein NTV48_03485 [Candidatus Vogelbacteria bacterium]|nr:hypothetical protein [Candidatus Vogelbacteria bacterium]
MKFGNWEISRVENKISPVEIILSVIAVGGIVFAGAVAGNAVQIFKKRKAVKYARRSYINTRLETLIKHGLVKADKFDGKTKLSLTDKGKKEILIYKYQKGEIKQKWDGKWRVVIFDIREKRRKIRDAFRNELRKIGFLYLQNSVWVIPYDCEEYVELLRTDLKSNYNVIYMEVSKIDREDILRERFNLAK